MAIVAVGNRERVYLDRRRMGCRRSLVVQNPGSRDTPSRGTWASNAQGRRYGFQTFGDYFTDRQLVALTTFSDLVAEARERILADAVTAGMPGDGVPLRDGGTRCDGVRGGGGGVSGVCAQ